VHDEIGFNYRLPNLNAALGCAQLEQLDGFLKRKRLLANAYDHAFAGIAGVQFAREPQGTTSNYWLNTILLDEAHAGLRDDVLTALNASGFGARPAWTLMHQLPMFATCPRGDLSVAESIERRLINLPSSASIQVRDD
jgi:perosamine synthetase